MEIELAAPDGGKCDRTKQLIYPTTKIVKNKKQETSWGVKRVGGGMQSMDLILHPSSNKHAQKTLFEDN